MNMSAANHPASASWLMLLDGSPCALSEATIFAISGLVLAEARRRLARGPADQLGGWRTPTGLAIHGVLRVETARDADEVPRGRRPVCAEAVRDPPADPRQLLLVDVVLVEVRRQGPD